MRLNSVLLLFNTTSYIDLFICSHIFTLFTHKAEHLPQKALFSLRTGTGGSARHVCCRLLGHHPSEVAPGSCGLHRLERAKEDGQPW